MKRALINPFKVLTTGRELQLRSTFLSGQCFRWKEVGDKWVGVVGDCVLSLKQDGEKILYQEHGEPRPTTEATLKDYFQLNHNIEGLYQMWSQQDPKLKDGQSQLKRDFLTVSKRIKGLRLLRQDPTECLFSFICSQNNNIPRIKSLIQKLCEKYGKKLTTIDDIHYFRFPSLEELGSATEEELKSLGFGYRSRYIVAATKEVTERGGDSWLRSLKTKPAPQVRSLLQELTGVGRKVADCVALFSLDQMGIVPVDTHVFQVAQRYMGPTLLEKMNASCHNSIQDFFGQSFGDKAGWAHTILFAGELKDFEQSKEEKMTPPKKKKKIAK